jgi:predicted transcriptional regulator
MPVGDVPALIREVDTALLRVSGPAGEHPADTLRPAVSPKR